MSVSEKIHIALGTDDNYCKYAGCCIASILLSAQKEERLCFYVVDNGISEENKARLVKLQTLRDHELIFLKPEMERLQDLPQCSYLGLSTYLRLLLPELLPDLDRLLYLDCDMIVTRPLSELWKTDLAGKAAGVVEDYGECFKEVREAEVLGIDFYFNAGMLLLDLKQIRERALFRDVLSWTLANSEKIKFGDQDGLNVFLKNERFELPACWNIQVNPFEQEKHPDLSKREAIKECRGIIHFVWTPKPDAFAYMSVQQEIFLKVLSKTPWAGEYEKGTLWKRIRKSVRRNRYYQIYRKHRIRIKKCVKRWIGKGEAPE